MRKFHRMKNRFSAQARAGYALAGAALLALPALVAFREGAGGATVPLVISVLFGIGYLIAAMRGGMEPQ